MPTASSDLVRAIEGHLQKLKGPDRKGWYTARCPFPDHEDKNPSFAFTETGYVCRACGRKGNLDALASELGIAYKNEGRSKRMTTRDAIARLHSRGLSAETIDYFKIKPHIAKRGWRFPVGETGAKFKNFRSDAKPKYWWDGCQSSGAEVYNIRACEGATEVWMVEGEADVWIAHQAKLPAVSLTSGANISGKIDKRMHIGVRAIASTGIQKINIIPDNDAAGMATARSIASEFQKHGLNAVLRPLPADAVGDKGDLTDLFTHLGKDGSRLAEELARLPELDASALDSHNPVSGPVTEAGWSNPVPLVEVEVPQFPTSVFPVWIREVVEQISVAIQTPTDLAGMYVLAVLSTIWARLITIEIRWGWTESLNLYGVAALESGSRKTAVCNFLSGPVRQFEAAQREKVRMEVQVQRFKRKALKARLKQNENEAAKAETDEERKAYLLVAEEIFGELRQAGTGIMPRLLADNFTPERLVSLMAEQSGRIAVLDAEGGMFGMLAGRYSSRPDLTSVLKAHTGEEIRVDRVGRESEFVTSPSLTLGLAVQPSILEALTSNPELRGTGLLARFLYYLPGRHVGGRNNCPPQPTPSVVAKYESSIADLLERAAHIERDDQRTLHFTEDAVEEIVAWMDWIEPELGEFGALGNLADWGAKLAGHTARIAALLHLADHVGHEQPWVVPIEADVVRRAVTIGRYLVPHAQAAHALMGQDPVVSDAGHVWRWISAQEGDVLSARDIFEATKGRVKQMRRLNAVLALLVEHGFLRESNIQARSGPGRKPSPRYDINPLARSQNSQISRIAA